MSTLSRILIAVVVTGIFYGCSPRHVAFSTDNFTNASFYQSLPAILNKNLHVDSVITYETTFEEKPYEGYYVIDYSEVNSRNDNNILHYKNFKGYYQKLYLLKLVTYPKDSVTIYFSLKYNSLGHHTSGTWMKTGISFILMPSCIPATKRITTASKKCVYHWHYL